jgi:hypothetical protein
MRNSLVSLLFLIILPLPLEAQDTLKTQHASLLPDYVKVQFAGNIGFISVGAGYSIFHSRLQTTLFYSYIPKSIGGAIINTVSWKNSFLIFNANIKSTYKISPYLGMSLAYSGYTPIQVLPHLGIRLGKNSHGVLRSKDIYLEVGTSGLYLNYYINNKDVRIYPLLNFSIGTTLFFNQHSKRSGW